MPGGVVESEVGESEHCGRLRWWLLVLQGEPGVDGSRRLAPICALFPGTAAAPARRGHGEVVPGTALGNRTGVLHPGVLGHAYSSHVPTAGLQQAQMHDLARSVWAWTCRGALG